MAFAPSSIEACRRTAAPCRSRRYGPGFARAKEAVTEAFFHTRGEVVLDAVVGRRAGAYLSRYSRSHRVQIADALVAAAASTAGLRLWTLNRRHYPMSGLVFHEG